MIIKEGVNFQLLVLALYVAAFYYNRDRFKKTGKFFIRDLTAIEKIKEGVGRATEMGSPVHWTYGTGALDAQHLAAFALLEYTASLCAKYDTRLIVSVRLPEVVPMTDAVIRKAYTDEGKPENYDPANVRFFGESHNAAMIGTISREKAAANFMIGSLFYEAILGVEASARNDAIQVGGTVNTHQLPFIAAGCDDTFIGAEMFAAATLINPTPIRVGSTAAEDWVTRFMVALMGLGALLATFGVGVLAKIVKG